MPWLIAGGQWLLRLIGGWLPLGNKPIGEYLGKILWVVGIVIALWFFLPKTPLSSIKTGSQKANQITNVYHQESPKATFGCASIKVKEYYDRQVTNAVSP